jgi:hypothetical protein
MEEQKLHEQNLDAQKRTHKTKNRTPGGSPRAREEHKKFNYLSQLRWQEGENLRSQAKAPEPSEDTNHPDVGLDGAEGKSIKTRTSGGPGARESLELTPETLRPAKEPQNPSSFGWPGITLLFPSCQRGPPSDFGSLGGRQTPPRTEKPDFPETRAAHFRAAPGASLGLLERP